MEVRYRNRYDLETYDYAVGYTKNGQPFYKSPTGENPEPSGSWDEARPAHRVGCLNSRLLLRKIILDNYTQFVYNV